jgi:RNA polymerase sigma factor (sigma-70 family)
VRGPPPARYQCGVEHTSGRADREALVRSALDVVTAQARRYRVWRMQRADLQQAGMVGLLVAAGRFDPGRGVPFRAFATHWVRKEIQRAIAEQEFAAAVPATAIGSLVALRGLLARDRTDIDVAAAALGISPGTAVALYRQLPAIIQPADDEDDPLAAALPGSAFPDPEAAAVAASTGAVLRQALAALDRPVAEALVLRYGLDGGPERSLREVARILGRSDHTVRALVERGHHVLREVMT